MTILDRVASTPKAAAGLLRLAPALFPATLFLSALLLFLVQPMFAKMVLPRLGGASMVWSAAMVFFQAALLLGYAYAHLLMRRLPLGSGAFVHLGVLAAAALTLPIGIAQGFATPPTSGIALWVIALFAGSIGLPFAALSASAPLLRPAVIGRPATPTSSTPPPTSDPSRRWLPIRSWSSRSSGSRSRHSSGRAGSPC
jgi:hypothetical protein